MVGDAYLSTIAITHTAKRQPTALIDSGSQISVVTEMFNMTPKPALISLNEFNLELKAARYTHIPYSGFILANIRSKIVDMKVETILLVAPVDESNSSAHVIISTDYQIYK
ncbi:hypothetical protein DPMN_145030 [Dreissena polymorpha]|uniref:Uncharacterized protein n=1 Tax=Dreissena polymorpha TaxID=45954 RepID=A0A9D4J0X1_DREPO|nr:hypothetical protein DPMN_145030 [Dreissena polymorpha]